LKQDISLITVTYNSEKIIADFLNQKEINLFKEVIVIDNNSNDDTSKIIKEKFPDIKLHVNIENIGFGSAMNFGAKIAKNKKVLLINPDTFFTKNFLKNLIFAIQEKPNFEVLLPTLIDYGCAVPNNNLEIKFIEPTVYGSCFLVNLEKFHNKIIFDENIFLFFEDYDLIKNLERKNERKITINNCYLIFKRGESSISKNIIKIKNWHYGWSYCYTLKKFNSSRVYKTILIKYFLKNFKRCFIFLLVLNFHRLYEIVCRLKGSIAFLRGVDAKKIGGNF